MSHLALNTTLICLLIVGAIFTAIAGNVTAAIAFLGWTVSVFECRTWIKGHSL